MDKYSDIATEIIKMAEVDQKIRWDPGAKTGDILKIDLDNRSKIKQIIVKHGFISQSRFGKDASYKAWLLIQHFPTEEVEFMKNYLRMMEDNLNDVDKRNFAYLKDRIALYQNIPQTFGTQTIQGDDKVRSQFHTIADVVNIDMIRKSMGLEPLKEYAKKFKNPVTLPKGYKS